MAEQIRQASLHIPCAEFLANSNGETLPAKFVDHIQYPKQTPISGGVYHEIITPDGIGVLRQRFAAGTVCPWLISTSTFLNLLMICSVAYVFQAVLTRLFLNTHRVLALSPTYLPDQFLESMSVGHAGHILAILNNLVVSLCLSNAWKDLAKVCRLFDAKPDQAFRLV